MLNGSMILRQLPLMYADIGITRFTNSGDVPVFIYSIRLSLSVNNVRYVGPAEDSLLMLASKYSATAVFNTVIFLGFCSNVPLMIGYMLSNNEVIDFASLSAKEIPPFQVVLHVCADQYCTV
jgi:hypothetical protein